MNENHVRKAIMGYLLLQDTEFHISEIMATLIRRFNVDVKFDKEMNAFTFQYEKFIVGASFVEHSMEMEGVVEGCKYNFLWSGAKEAVSKHQAHVLLSIMNCNNKLEGYKLFSNLMSVFCNFDNTIAVYMPAQALTLNSKTYVEDSRVLVTGRNPVHLWVCICPVYIEDATVVYTYGLNEFGKNEIEVRSTKRHFMELFDFVYHLADSIIGKDIEIQDGDEIGTADGEVLTAHVNDGVYIDRVSVKFDM